MRGLPKLRLCRTERAATVEHAARAMLSEGAAGLDAAELRTSGQRPKCARAAARTASGSTRQLPWCRPRGEDFSTVPST